MESKNYKLTSVKVDKDLYTEFKIKSIREGITFQTLVNKTLHMFVDGFNFNNLTYDMSGSLLFNKNERISK